MKKKTLRVPGMRVPRLFIFIFGLIAGRLKMADLNPETGCISSGYITEKLSLYNSLSHNRVKMLEDETSIVRSEAFDIMVEETQIRMLLAEMQAEVNQAKEMLGCMKSTTIQEIREVQKNQVDRHKLLSEQERFRAMHRENMKRLGEIDEKIRTCELKAREELEAIATALQSIFATYTKGVLLRPVYPEYIPAMAKYDFDLYKQSHKAEDEQMRNILKEVFDHE